MLPRFVIRPHHAAPGRAARELWWLDPRWIVVAMLVPIYLSFLAFDYSRVVPVAYVPSGLYFWGLGLLLALVLGATFGTQRAVAPGGRNPIVIPRWLPALLLAGTLTAYIAWFHPLATRPELIIEVLSSERANVRDEISTMPPLTTLTQWGVAYAIVYAIRRGQGRTAAWEGAGLWLIILFALLRSIVWSERLALIEVLACYAVALLAFHRCGSAWRFRVAGLAPLVAPPLLYLLFTASEYFRSWTFYRRYYDSIWRFAFDRLTAYYAVASNNGLGLLAESSRWPTYDGSYLLQWAFPRPLADASNFQFTAAQYDYERFLVDFARPELNNPSGLFVIVYDVGYFGSALYFLMIGALIGIAYRGYRQQQAGGLLFYPVCVLFLVELLRFNYFSASRFLPILLALLLGAFSAYRGRRRFLPRVAGGQP